MRDKYWAMFVALKYKECYYKHYRIRTMRYDAAIAGICLFTSAASIASWSFWTSFPGLWGALIALAQLVQVLRPLFPFSKQLVALRFLTPDLSRLLVDIDFEWSKTHTLDDSKISSLIHKHDFEYATLVSRFVGDNYFPDSSHCVKAAEKDCKTYFYQRYNAS